MHLLHYCTVKHTQTTVGCTVYIGNVMLVQLAGFSSPGLLVQQLPHSFLQIASLASPKQLDPHMQVSPEIGN